MPVIIVMLGPTIETDIDMDKRRSRSAVAGLPAG
jgi:hypothetical protein